MLGHHREFCPRSKRASGASRRTSTCVRSRWSPSTGVGAKPTPSLRIKRTWNLLIEELGVDPSPELRELEGRILAQDRALDARSPAPPGRSEFSTIRVERLGALRACSSSTPETPSADAEPAGHDDRPAGRRRHRVRRSAGDRLHAEVRVDGRRFVIVEFSPVDERDACQWDRRRRQVLESGDQITIGGAPDALRGRRPLDHGRGPNGASTGPRERAGPEGPSRSISVLTGTVASDHPMTAKASMSTRGRPWCRRLRPSRCGGPLAFQYQAKLVACRSARRRRDRTVCTNCPVDVHLHLAGSRELRTEPSRRPDRWKVGTAPRRRPCST